MRKRPIPTEAIVPRPCQHEDITYDGRTAPACLWGRTTGYAIPVVTAVGDRMIAARREHEVWAFLDGGFRRVAQPELLAPDGTPWQSQRGTWTE